MKKMMIFLLLWLVPVAHAHVGHHDPGFIAAALHAFSGLAPVLPLFAVGLLAWLNRRFGCCVDRPDSCAQDGGKRGNFRFRRKS